MYNCAKRRCKKKLIARVDVKKTQSAKTIWGKVVLYLKEKKHIALQIACGDIIDTRLEDDKFVITTDDAYLEKILTAPENKKIIEDALAWQGIICNLEVHRKLKTSELQKQDIEKLKSLGLEIKVEKGEKK